MTPERWKRITEIYSDICDLPSAEQSARLDQLSAADPALAAEIRRLLATAPSEGKAVVDNPPFADLLAQFTSSGRRLEPAEILAGRFEIVRHLGSGGMGEVYEAVDNHLHTRVAIKLIRRDIANQADALARFRREIALARQVTHRSVCRVFDFFPSSPTSRGDSVDFLTMELLQGETLADMLLREAPISLSRALPILAQLTSALDAAHAAGVLHRDLKGSNVFLTTDAEGLRAVITDFGLARSAAGGDAVSSGSAWGAGTPLFMSPEQLEGGELGPQSDLYSLGVLMYQMATGVAPLQGNSPLQIAVKRVKEPPVSPRERNPKIEAAWESAILRCLAIHPKERYRNGAELLAALGRPRRPFRWPKKPVLLAAAAVALAAGGWWGLSRLSPPPVRPEAARWFREGEIALADGAVTKASKLFERAVEGEPGYLSARCRLAETYVELDMRDRAQEEILTALNGRPRNAAERLLCEGVKATLTGQWDQAIAAAKDRNAPLDEARWNEQAGRSPAAAAIYESVIATDASQPGPLLRLANIRIREGQNAAAESLLSRAEANFRTLANSEGLGEVALARSRVAKTVPDAIALAEEAIRRGKESASDWLLVRAMLWHADRIGRLGKLDESRPRYQEAIDHAERTGLAGQAASGLIDLGSVSFAQRKYEEAEPIYRKALQLAQRYRAHRAEARARLTLGQMLTLTTKFDQAAQSIDEALSYFRAVGDAVQAGQALVYRGDLLTVQAKYPQANAAYTEAIAVNPSPRGQVTARQRLATVALRRTRYEEAAARFAEVVEALEQMGDRAGVQTYRSEQAKALTAVGRFQEADALLQRTFTEKPVTSTVAWRLNQAQAGLDFQRLRFEDSIKRIQSMLLAADKQKTTFEADALHLDLCTKYAEWDKPALAASHCAGLLKTYAGQSAVLVGIHTSLALVHLSRRQFTPAIAEARRGVALAAAANDLRNDWYTSLVLAQALHASRNPEWKTVREHTRSLLARMRTEFGDPAIDLYLTRPLIVRRYKAVENLQ